MQVGDGARKTNYDYTGGNLEELIDVTIEGGARIFVCAIGVPPPTVVTKLHDNDIIVMNMIGAPHHVEYALKAGVDVVIAQGSEGGGHTGDIGTMALIPEVVDLCRGRKNFWGNPVQVVAAGGVTDGRGLAAALALGATGVWVGTRFVASEESAAPKAQKNKIIRARASDTVRTCVFTGRPCRILPTKLVKEWEAKPEKMRKLLDEGIIPIKYSLENETATGKDVFELFNSLSGQGCGVINDVKPAAEIVSSMVREASEVLHEGTRFCKL